MKRKPSWIRRQWRTAARFIRLARQRWNAESPAFFRRLGNWSVTLGTVATTMLVGNKASETYDLLPVVLLPCVKVVGQWIAAGAYGMFIASKFAAKNPPEEHGQP